jgi:hypothetical protein
LGQFYRTYVGEVAHLSNVTLCYMAIVFDRDFGRVWSDGTTPCVFSSIVRVPQLHELDELALKQIQVIQELKHTFGNVYSILDLRLCQVIPEQVVRHYIGKIMPGQFRAGVKHKAFVAPEEKKSLGVFMAAFAEIAALPVSIHGTFEEALNEINQKRTQRNDIKRKKSVFRFFTKLSR